MIHSGRISRFGMSKSIKLGTIIVLTIVALFLMALPFVSRAATHTVGSSGTFATIQDAVDAASPGDTIMVQAETFTAGAVITKSVYIWGGYDSSFINRVPRTTVISPTGSAFDVQGIGLWVTLDGFEIYNADANAIYVDVEDDAQIIINDNYVHENSDTGIYADVLNRNVLQITNNDVMSNTTIGHYGGIYVYGEISTTLTLTGNQVISNSAGNSYGGAYVGLEDFAQFTIEDNMVMSNTASNTGGGLYFDAEYQIYGVFNRNQVIGNRANGGNYGGGYFYLGYGSSSDFYDNEFRDNFASSNHGGLYLYPYYNTQIKGDNLIIADNTADSYGGGYWDVEYNASADLPNTQITGNEATSGSYGGLYFYDYNGSVITATNLTIYNNRASSNYGGFYLDLNDGGERFIAPNSQIISNTAGSGYGGGYIATDDQAYVDMTYSQIISNTAQSGNGGGLYFSSVEYGSIVRLNYSRFISNTASNSGGGLYVREVYAQSKMDLSYTEFMTNTAGSSGGGAYFSTGPNYNGQVTLSYARFISNTASSDGGGLYMGDNYYNNWAEAGPSMQADHMQFIRNTAGGEGGGLYLDDAYEGAQVILDDSLFQENSAEGDGGALYGAYCYEGCSFSLSRSAFYSNTTNTGDGGAVYYYQTEYGSEAYFDDNTFINNSAGSEGGAFYTDYFAYDGSRVSFSRNSVISNTAGSDGGGIHVQELTYDGGTAFFNNNEVISNTADGDGGGIYFGYLTDYGGEVHFNNNRVENNQSDGDGGGVIVDSYGCYYGGDVDMNRNTFINNVAEDGDGAGLYLDDITNGCRFWFQDNIITGNVISSTAGYDGGGIWMYGVDEGSFMWMTGNQINDNIATDNGGGLYFDDSVDYGSIWTFEDNQLQRNWAGGDGGGIWFDDVDDGASIYFNRNLLNDNVALSDGGGAYFSSGIIDGNTADFMGNQFNRNTAGGDYGALYMEDLDDGTIFRFWDNEVIGNRAGITETAYVNAQVVLTTALVMGGDGGGLWFESIEYGSEANLRNNLILSNTAYVTYTNGITPVNGDFGGLYADLNSTSGLLTMQGNTIASNSAQKNYGGVAIELYDASRLVMVRNLITANTAITQYGGLTIWGGDDSQYYLDYNKIINNSAASMGGLVIDNRDAPDPLWGRSMNNLIAGNSGSGVYIKDTNFWSTNDTIADNPNYGIMMSGTITSTTYLSNTILWGNTNAFTKTTVPTYTNRFTMLATTSDIEGGWPGAGNINADPLFEGSGNYHLQAGSPAINTGATVALPTRDLDNIPRPVGLAYDMGAYEYHVPGVSVNGGATLYGDPGTWVTHTLTISNTGDAEDSFSLALSGNTWPAQLQQNSVVVSANDYATVQLRVYVPGGASAGDSDMVTLDATSTRNSMVVDSDTVETVANQVANVVVYPNNQASAAEGATQLYLHTVTNLGNGTDTFNLTATSSQGWSANVVPAQLTLSEGLSATVEVRVTVPVDGGGLVDVTTVGVTSTFDSGISASAYDITTGTDAPVANLLFTPDNSAIVVPGSTQIYSHTLINNGNSTDSISLSANSSQGWAIDYSPNLVTLGSGLSATVVVTVTAPPSGPDGLADVTTVVATSGLDNNVSATVLDVSTLNNPSGITLSAGGSSTLQPNQSATYSHILSNNGASADLISLAVNSNQGWTVAVNPTSVNVGAGLTTTVLVTVTAPTFGVNGTIDVTTLTATSGNNASVQASASNITTLDNPSGATLTPNNTRSALVGTVENYYHTLTNTSGATDTITLSASSDLGWGLNLNPSAVNLGPGASAPVTLTVTLPVTGANGLTDVSAVQARSTNGGSALVAVAVDVTTLLNPASLKLSLGQASSTPADSTVAYTYTLTNDGVQMDTLALSSVSSQGWVTQHNQNAITLQAGESATVVLQVQVPAGATVGATDVTTLTATSSFGTAARVSNASTTTVADSVSRIFLPLVMK